MVFPKPRSGRHEVAPLVKLLWSAYAHVYDGLLDFYPYRKLLDTVTDRLRLRDGLRLLDVGCGTGNVMIAAASKAAITMHGIDVAPAMIGRARRKLDRWIQGRTAEVSCREAITAMRSMPDGCFDRICLMNVLYAVPDRRALWRECMRLLAPAGHIVATTSTKLGILPLIREHAQNAPLWRLTSPSLMGVCFFDGLIRMLANARQFSFPSADVLYAEILGEGGVPSEGQRAYGGEADGVNVLFTVHHSHDARRGSLVGAVGGRESSADMPTHHSTTSPPASSARSDCSLDHHSPLE